LIRRVTVIEQHTQLGGIGGIIGSLRKIAGAIINQYDRITLLRVIDPDQINIAIAIYVSFDQPAMIRTIRRKTEYSIPQVGQFDIDGLVSAA